MEMLTRVRRGGAEQGSAGVVRPRRRFGLVVSVAVLSLGLAACSSPDESTSTPSAPSAAVSGELTVFAATSLTEAFNQIGSQFQTANPGVKVTFNFAGSSALATQITQGAPADVFASAAPANMTTVTDASLTTSEPRIFAQNEGEILVESGNPKGITSVADLADPAIKVAVCAPEVPCGAVAKQIFDNAGVTVTPVTQEENVGGVVTKVTLGEVDAGIVYVTDALANASKATGIAIPADVNASTSYPIAPIEDGANPAAAAAFISYVLSADGQQVLADFGFKPPA